MNDILGRLLTFIADNAAAAGPLLGLLAFTESLIVIGMFVPAVPLMFAVGG